MSTLTVTTAPVTAAEAAIAQQFGATITRLAEALRAITRTDIDLREATAQLSDAAYELDEAVLAAADAPPIRAEVLETAVAERVRDFVHYSNGALVIALDISPTLTGLDPWGWA
ncbi:hypothetical protein A5789_24920 [Nocardia sp. 852002-51101_SCH5132738]|uniref:hypothetical protein n=1 Tax=Nocardia sp. 852002-51101_SCH5132738 TaxID=1834095 RepID=UPI0007EA9E3B|nr:hypothetical protein [Nocardia sp. 852002-51101_SCH5132738]OBA53055.1 hypothetical protein A5789_24920 [Nocardia sp. 852002-51101_SCH5132738]